MKKTWEMSSGVLLTHFSGGLETLFSNERRHQTLLPVKDETGRPANLGFLIRYLCDRVMKDTRHEMFVLDGTV